MSAAENKQLVQEIFSSLAQGDGQPFVDCMADDFCWTIPGKTKWSRTYYGKHAVLAELMKPLFAQFADRYTSTAKRIIAEDDYVVVECWGRATTRSGKPYDNQYCHVIRFAGGKMRELTEYMDTELVTAALSA